MLQAIKSLFGLGPKTDYAKLLSEGAQLVDVRSKEEYQSGHIKGSLHISLQELHQQLGKLKKDKPVITCCASGMRSASAVQVLKANGFTQVYNGGGWRSLSQKLN